MFSAWVNLQDARQNASLQGGEVPHEASRVLNRANSIKQKLPSIPEDENNYEEFASEEGVERTAEVAANHAKETFGKSRVAGETTEEAVCKANKEKIDAEKHLKSPFESGEVRSSSITKVSSELTSRSLESVEDERVAGHMVNKYVDGEKEMIELFSESGEAVKVRREVEATATDILRVKLFSNRPQYEGFTRLNIPIKHVDNKLRLSEAAYGRKCSSSIELIVKSEFTKKDIEYGNLLEQFVFFARSSKDSQFIYDIGKLARYDVWDAKHPTQQESGEFNIEQRFGGLQHVRDFAKLKLAGGAYIKKCFGSIVLLKKHAKDNPVGDFNAKMNGDAFVKTETIIEARAGVSAGGPAVSRYALGSGMSIHNQRCRASKRVYSQKHKVNGDQGAGILKQPGRLDAVKRDNSLEQLHSGVTQMEVPDGHMLIEYADCIKRYKANTLKHSQGFDAKEFMHYENYENVFKHAYVIRDYEDAGPLIKHDRFKISGAVCLEEKHRAFNRGEFNFLLKHMDYEHKLEQKLSSLRTGDITRLKSSGTAYVENSIGSFGFFAKPIHTIKVGRLKDIDPRFQRRLKDIYHRFQREERIQV